MYFSSLPPAVGLMKDGKVRALAVTGAKRSPRSPTCRRWRKPALPGYEAVLHYGIVAPAGTPRPIIDKLSAALRDAVMAEDPKEQLAKDGAEPLPSTPEEYAADIDREETKWSAIVKDRAPRPSERRRHRRSYLHPSWGAVAERPEAARRGGVLSPPAGR